MARTLFSRAGGLPSLIHHEDGFNEDEQVKLNWKRNWFRKFALGGSQALVVPSETIGHYRCGRLETAGKQNPAYSQRN